eukprot:6628669-Pyramimonas_sp.AAC.1
MLLNRPSLSVFKSVYDFARMFYRHRVPLWPSVRQLVNAIGVLPLLMEASMDPQAVRDVDRWSER